jgi:murein DD-endopeptidase MepM/ murein hydrolase activator NlpD
MKIADLFVDLKLDATSFGRELATTLRRASSEKVTVGVDLDTKAASASQAQLARDQKMKITVDVDTKAAAASLAKVAKDQKMSVAVEADTKSASASLAKVAKNQKMSVAVDANTEAANIKLDRVARTREAKVKVDVEGQKGINFAFKGVSNLSTAIASLGGSAIPILSAVTAGVGTLGSSMLAAGGAGGAFALSIQGQVQAFKAHKANVKIIQSQIDKYGRAVESAQNSVDSATKGSESYRAAQERLAAAQKDLKGAQEGMRLENQAFRKDFGETEKGLDRLKDAFYGYTHATAQDTSKTLGAGLSLVASILPRLVPLGNAAAQAIGGLVGELAQFSKTQQFQNLLDFFQRAGPAALTSFGHIVGNVVLGIINIFTSFEPQQQGLLSWIEEITRKFRVWTESIGGSDGFTQWMNSVKANLPALQQLVVNLTQVIAKFVQGLGPLAALQFKGMTILADQLNRLPPRAFTALATAIAAVVVGLKAWELTSKAYAVASRIATAATATFTAVQKGAQGAALGTRIQLGLLRVQTIAVAAAQKVVAIATKGWALAQKALNLVMNANPLAKVITVISLLVVGVIYAYKHFDKFRKVVDTAWAAIKKAANVAWTFLKGVFASIGRWVTGSLIPWFKQLWDYVKKAFKGIGTAVQWVWDHVVKPVFNGYKFYITKVVIPAVQKLWDFAKKAFAAIGSLIKAAWDNVVKPIFSHYQTYINKVVIPVIQKLWDFVKKAFAGIGSLIKAAWDNVVKPIFSHYQTYINKVVIPVIQKLWDFVKKAFAGIGDLIKGSWDRVISPAFVALRRGLGKVKDAFTEVRDWVKDKWGEIENAAKKPVRFVVNTVIRDGIIAAINKIPALPNIKFDGVKFAKGGVMPGYTPGRDVHQFHSPTAGNLALSGGEAIMRPEWTQAVGGEKAVNKINKMAAQHKFARGGLFRPVHGGSLVQGIHDTSTGFPAVDLGVPVGTPVYAGHSGRVTVSKDLRGYEPRIAHQNGYRSYGKYIQIAGAGMSTLYAHLSRRSKGRGAAVSGGSPIGLSGLTGHTYGPHLHFGARGISPMAFLGGAAGHGVPGGAVSGSGSSAEVGHLQDQQSGALSGIHPKEWIAALKNMGGFGPMLGSTVSHLAGSGVNFIKDKFGALISKAKELASKIGHGISSFIGKINPWDGGSGHLSAADARGAGKKMMPKSWSWPALLKLWNGESGWRWNADNPGSSAYGIPQALPGSKMASSGKDWHDNAVTQIKWGLGYIGSRYGNSQTAYRDWLGRSPHWYDTGGWLQQGRTMAVNNTGKPEAILTSQQWTQMERLIGAVENGGRAGGAPLIGHAVIRENVDLDRYERQRAFRDRRTRV